MPNSNLLAAALAVLAAVVVAAGGASAQGWQRDDWNPVPAPDDVILPLPCGGSIALRPVLTGPPRQPGKGNQLEDRQVTLGSADETLSYLDYLRSDYVAGGFFTADGRRYYLIGKYEVTVQQYEAVMGDGSCRPTPPERAALPVTNVSWFDAVDFTHRWNKWLYAEHLGALPKAAGRAGFARLPTEVEWEFAARGGLKVTDAERDNPTFVPAGANLSEYAWFAGPESSNGKPREIGGLKPNPLGLYDVLGNAEEIMLEPFRLNRAGRLHGEQGGTVVRGGSYVTPRESINAATRTEFAPFDETTKSEKRLPSFGFRIVVNATSLSRVEQVAALKKEWEEARRGETSVSGRNPLQLLDGLLKQASPADKPQLQAAITQLTAEAGKNKELRASVVKNLLNAGLTIRKNLEWAALYLNELHRIITVEGKKGGVQAEVAKRAQLRFDEQYPNFRGYALAYADLVKQLGSDDIHDTEVAAGAQELKSELAGRGRGDDQPRVDATVGNVRDWRSGKARDTNKITISIVGPQEWLR